MKARTIIRRSETLTYPLIAQWDREGLDKGLIVLFYSEHSAFVVKMVNSIRFKVGELNNDFNRMSLKRKFYDGWKILGKPEQFGLSLRDTPMGTKLIGSFKLP